MTIHEQIKKEAECRYPITRGNSNDENHRNVDRHVIWDEACNWLLSNLQVPVWVKASDEIWPYGTEVLIEIKNGDKLEYVRCFAHNVIECWGKENIRWLKPSPLLPLIEANQKIEELEEKILGLEKRLAVQNDFIHFKRRAK